MPRNDEAITVQTAGFASDLAGIPSFLIDPESAAKRVHSRWFWVAALLVAGVIAIAVSRAMMPYIIHVTAVGPLQNGMTEEIRAKQLEAMTKWSWIGEVFSPITVAVMWAIQAVILLGIATVTGVTARFVSFFNLVAGCGLIQSLASIATAIILHFKDEPSSTAELTPAMGLDIFMPEGMNKYLVALGGSFSLFEIWWIVMLALVFAAAFRVSKAKAFATVFPLWVLMLLWRLGVTALRK